METLLLFLVAAVTPPAAPPPPRPNALQYVVPDAVSACVQKWEAGTLLYLGHDPFYLRGDFDGDGRFDHATAVIRGDKRGIAFCWGDSKPPIVLGAGNALSEGGDALDFTRWRIHAASEKVGRGAGEGSPPVLRGDAILVEWGKTASALVYWSGTKVRRYRQSD